MSIVTAKDELIRKMRQEANVAEVIDCQAMIPSAVAGWCGGIAELYSQEVMRASDTACFVEVGSWLGKSTIAMAQMIRASKKKIRFYCVDHFKGSGSDLHHFQHILDKAGGTVRPIFDYHLEQYGVREMVRVIQMDSAEAAEKFVFGGCDFVFIDADHAYENVVRDIEAWLPKVRRGGVLAGHDWGYMGVAQAVMDTLPGPIYATGQVWCYYKP